MGKDKVTIKSSQSQDHHTIKVAEKSCSCCYWLKKKICVHSLAWSQLNGLGWFGPAYFKSVSFYYKSKKGGRIKNAESAYIRGD